MGSVAKKGLQQYLGQLQKRPLRTKVLTAGVLSAISDIVAQKRSGIQKLQLKRTFTQSEIFGAAYLGPFGHFYHMMLDKIFKGKKDTKTVAKKGLLRCFKSCRLKWTNYLRPDVKRGLLLNYEEKMVIDLHAQLGNRWSKIASHLPGRTDNDIKNHGLDWVGFDTKNVYSIIMELQEKSNWTEKSSVFSFIDKK
ncbi:hypothetical protein CASFOL_013193 [Castilleja foliolosa]|uniref:Myb-like domain-containing protein n=1 Tax=Castilleja foliolosa TaxID=1961234 RepID=A0ABD3DJV3_9LAMI